MSYQYLFKTLLLTWILSSSTLLLLAQITIEGTYFAAFNQKSDVKTLYYSTVGTPFSKEKYLKIDNHNQYSLTIEDSNQYPQLIFSTDWTTSPQPHWCLVSSAINLDTLTKMKYQNVINHDIIINENCSEMNMVIVEVDKKYWKFVSTYYFLEPNIYSINLDSYGDVIIEYKNKLPELLYIEKGQWTINEEKNEVKLTISSQHNYKIGLYKKVKKEIILSYEETVNNDINLKMHK